MEIGALIYANLDQLDCTGPFEVLSRIPGAQVHMIGKDLAPVRDVAGLILTPTVTLASAPALDVLVVPGGRGQIAAVEDEAVLQFVARPVTWILSVCTGALTCGAAGLLRGRRATTHWNSFHLLRYFGATPVDERVVIDGNLITTAGVSAGIDGALKLASWLAGDTVARRIQIEMQYAPEPPFALQREDFQDAARRDTGKIAAARLDLARKAAGRLGVQVS